MIVENLKGKKVKISSSGTFRDVSGIIEEIGEGLVLVKDDKGNRVALPIAQIGIIRIQEGKEKS
ncbi:MAG: hypothetical protein QXX95_07820 [Nitrososphaerales archaeon]